MKKIKIKIGNKEYTVELASSDDDRQTGLQNRDSLSENEGMLFEFEEEDNPIVMWMKDTKIPLDLIFIDDNLEVVFVEKGEPLSEKLIEHSAINYVLELNQNSGIKEGDELEFITDNSLKKDKMYVLDENGASQMELSGGERIMSRANTKTLIKFAKRAYSTNNDNDYKALGKRVFKFIQVQNSNEPEFVESKQ